MGGSILSYCREPIHRVFLLLQGSCPGRGCEDESGAIALAVSRYLCGAALYPNFTPFCLFTFYERSTPVARERNPTAPRAPTCRHVSLPAERWIGEQSIRA